MPVTGHGGETVGELAAGIYTGRCHTPHTEGREGHALLQRPAYGGMSSCGKRPRSDEFDSQICVKNGGIPLGRGCVRALVAETDIGDYRPEAHDCVGKRISDHHGQQRCALTAKYRGQDGPLLIIGRHRLNGSERLHGGEDDAW